MGSPRPFGTGITLATGTGTGNANALSLAQYHEAAVISVFATMGAVSQGPVWCELGIRTGGALYGCADGWVRGDSAFQTMDWVVWNGRIPLIPMGNSAFLPYLRNDSGSTVNVQVGGVLEVFVP